MNLYSSLALFFSFVFYSFTIKSDDLFPFIANLAACLVLFNLFLTMYKTNYRLTYRKQIEEEVRNEMAFAKIDAKRKFSKVVDV